MSAAPSRKNAEVTPSASPMPIPGKVAIAPIVYGATAPAIDETSFGTSTAAFYWSSTPAFTATADGYAAALQTDVGIESQRRMTDLAAARCVRQAR